MATEETFNQLSLCMVKLVLNLTFFASNLSYFTCVDPIWIRIQNIAAKMNSLFLKFFFPKKAKTTYLQFWFLFSCKDAQQLILEREKI